MIHPKLMKRLKAETSINVLYSGGEDSTALLFLLRDLFGPKVSALHINSKLIPWDDDAAAFCVNYCQLSGIDCNIVRAKGNYVCGSKESFCREQRKKIIEDNPGFYVTAHHLSDAVESYLMNCFRGHDKHLPMPIETKFGNSTVFRPFLLTGKKNIVNYVHRHELTTLDDPLNKESRRGWIRSSLMPILEEGYPGLEKVVRKIYLKKLK